MNTHTLTDMLLKMEAQSNSFEKCHRQFIINDTVCH